LKRNKYITKEGIKALNGQRKVRKTEGNCFILANMKQGKGREMTIGRTKLKQMKMECGIQREIR
jgi:hypothetical protein